MCNAPVLFVGRAPVANAGAYCVAKAGIEMMSDILRLEMKDWGVNVSIIEPSAFQTGNSVAQYDKPILVVCPIGLLKRVKMHVFTSYKYIWYRKPQANIRHKCYPDPRRWMLALQSTSR